jgi:hypothetical protein
MLRLGVPTKWLGGSLYIRYDSQGSTGDFTIQHGVVAVALGITPGKPL